MPGNVNLRRVVNFVINESFINWNQLKPSQSMADQQIPISGHDMPQFTSEHAEILNSVRGVSRIFIIGFPTSGLRRYFNRGDEATS